LRCFGLFYGAELGGLLVLLPLDGGCASGDVGSVGVGGFDYHWELGVVDPTLRPIYSWLDGGKPGVSQYHALGA
jgi:hypothetical protein